MRLVPDPYPLTVEAWGSQRPLLVPAPNVVRAVGATFVHRSHGCPAAAAHEVRRRRRGFAGSTAAGVEPAVAAPWAAPTARTILVQGCRIMVPIGPRLIILRRARLSTPPSRANGNRQTLYHPRLALSLAGKHAVIQGEVAADGVSARCGGLTGERLGVVPAVGCVLSIVDSDCTCPTTAGLGDLERWIGPVPPLA